MHNARILVAEPRHTEREIVRLALTRVGYTAIEQASTSTDVTSLVERIQPDLLITNVCLAENGDGIATAVKLKDRLSAGVIFITDQLDTETIERGRAALPVAYLTQPLQELALVAAVTTALDRSHREGSRRLSDSGTRNQQKLASLAQMAGGLSHEFNNLLTTILGYASLAAEGLPATSPVQEMLQQIETAALRGADLGQRLLAYSGRGRLVDQPVDLSRLLSEMAGVLRATCGGMPRPIILNFELADPLPNVQGDVMQLRQMVVNLVTNAAEACAEPPSGKVAIKTGVQTFSAKQLESPYLSVDGPPGDYLVLEVTDDGCGMEPAVLASAFDPFFSTRHPGRGLGLPAVQGIVRGHKGGIQVTSQPGAGSTFRVLLPIFHGKPKQPAPQTEPRTNTGPRSGTLLVVDDEQGVLSSLRASLEGKGYIVLAASDGLQALDLCNRHAQELAAAIIDLTLPEMNGEEVLREMRRLRPTIPVLIVSGHDEQEIQTRLTGMQHSSFLRKPFRFADVLDRLGAIL